MSVTRKCSECGNTLTLTYSNISDVVCYGNKFYHSNCFINMCNNKLNSKNTKKKKWKEALKSIDEYKHEAFLRLKDALDKDELYRYILEFYDITIIPNAVWTKLDAVNNGTYRGMYIGIPYTDLLDMWKRKSDELNRIYVNNVKLGKDFSTEHRINYDISVLINKYDSYLRWKEKKKILETKQENVNTDVILTNHIQDIETYDDGDDISALVDDIFN